MKWYDIDGKKYASVTSVLGELSKGYGFEAWLTNNEADYIQMLQVYGKQVGQEVHQWISSYLLNTSFTGELLDESKLIVETFKDWWKRLKATRVVELEKVLVSRKHRYAGTCDMIVNIDNRVYIYDWKTSNVDADIYRLQLAAYVVAAKEEGYDISGAKVVRFGKEGQSVSEIAISEDDIEYLFRLFKGLLDLFYWRYNPDKRIRKKGGE